MKKFERFIIYPMLFIVLFFSFAGEDVQQTTAQQVYDEIIAKNIKIVDDEGEIMIELKREDPSENIYNLLDHPYGKIVVSGDYENKNFKNMTEITPGNFSIDKFNDKKSNISTYNSNLSAKSLSLNNNKGSIYMKVDKQNGNNITVENISADVTTKNINNHKKYKNFIQIGRNMIAGKNKYDPITSFNSTIGYYNQEIKNEEQIVHTYPKYNDLELSIAREIVFKSEDNKKQVYIGGNSSSGGYISIFNNNEKPVVRITQTQSDEKGERGGHGGIWIFDKYGEDFRSYTYK